MPTWSLFQATLGPRCGIIAGRSLGKANRCSASSADDGMLTLARFFTVVTLVILALALVPLAVHGWALLHFPYELDPGEGVDVGAAAVLLSGGQLYGVPTQFPFFGLNYP